MEQIENQNSPVENFLEWETWEYLPKNHNSDWFWLIGTVAVITAVISIALSNILFALIIIIGVASLFMYEKRDPRKLKIKITDRGIQIQNDLYIYDSIKSFWVAEKQNDKPARLIINCQRLFLPNIHIPLENTPPNMVRDLLTDKISEDKHEPNLIEAIGDFFGF